MENNGITDEIVAGTAVAGIVVAVRKIIGYLKTSQLELFWNKVDTKIASQLAPLISDINKIQKDLHETKKIQEGVHLEMLRTLDSINNKLVSPNGQ